MTIVKAKKVSESGGATDEPRRGRGRPQQRSDVETRTIIVEAARTEFAHSGYAATGMENVARRAGVSTKTLYRLFPNKAAVFEAMVTERIEAFVSVVKLRACDGQRCRGGADRGAAGLRRSDARRRGDCAPARHPCRQRQVSRRCGDVLLQGDHADAECPGQLAAGAAAARHHRA